MANRGIQQRVVYNVPANRNNTRPERIGFNAASFYVGIINESNYQIYVHENDVMDKPNDAISIGSFKTRSFPLQSESGGLTIWFDGADAGTDPQIVIFYGSEPVELYGGNFAPQDVEDQVTIKDGSVALKAGNNLVGSVNINNTPSVTIDGVATVKLNGGTSRVGTVGLDTRYAYKKVTSTTQIGETIGRTGLARVIIAVPKPSSIFTVTLGSNTFNFDASVAQTFEVGLPIASTDQMFYQNSVAGTEVIVLTNNG